MISTTSVKGQIAVAKSELRALELGFIPSRPCVDARYDLILDKDGKLSRVQVKYADGQTSNSAGSISVRLSHENRSGKASTYFERDTDYLIVYLARIDKLCLLPLNVFAGKTRIYLRYVKPKNNQSKGIIPIEEYLW